MNIKLRRYQLRWNPVFNLEDNARIYIMGEKTKMRSFDNDPDNAEELPEHLSYDEDNFSFDEILRVAHNSILILPFNSNVALAQEYSVGIKNRVIEYDNFVGSTIVSFGQAARQIGLDIVVIKHGQNHQVYRKGLEALAYISANSQEYLGTIELIGYDLFDDSGRASTDKLKKYDVKIEELTFTERSDRNNMLRANLKMKVTKDYSNSDRRGLWGMR